MARVYANAVRFIRKSRWNSQPVFVEASNGLSYLLDFRSSSQSPNALFNEAAGIELFKACWLFVPFWQPIDVTNDFIDRNPDCWTKGRGDPIRPEAGLSLGRRLHVARKQRMYELLPRLRYLRVKHRTRLWLAWLIDACSGQTNSRGALFQVNKELLFEPVFMDSRGLFGGPSGVRVHPLLPRGQDASRVEQGNPCSATG